MPVPHPTGRAGLLRLFSPAAQQLTVRYSPLSNRDKFDQASWPMRSLNAVAAFPGWWEWDVDALGLPDGAYEYEFLLNGDADHPIADPYAEEITRFAGYRGILRIKGGTRVPRAFRWDDEIPAGKTLPQNNQIVIYEMPLRWMSTTRETSRQVDMGTFDKVIFERLNNLVELGINCIELLPVQDSPDTLDWGYGTRFFFAPDFDMGTPIDAKYFVKRCHQVGIRVFLDVVMNHSDGDCPLSALARDSYYIGPNHPEEGRATEWSSSVFRYRDPDNGYYAGREFQYEMAEYWVREYRIDGFRIDEFKGINNWDFVRTFRDRAWAEHLRLFPDRPFFVVAEDTNRRFEATHDTATRPKIVEALWNFSYRDDARRLATNQVFTNWGQPSRSERIRALLKGNQIWDAFGAGSMREGYADMAQAVNYFTSHDVKEQPRMMNYLFGALLTLRGLGQDNVDFIRNLVSHMPAQGPTKDAHTEALDRIRSAFALLLTAVGIPMFLAGEEFGEVHDLQYSDDSLKMSDPVNWDRMNLPGHRSLWNAVRDLVHLRTSARALQRNEIDFFYFHPDTDNNTGARVFAYCRTAGQSLGASGQVIVVANMGAESYGNFVFPFWPWGEVPEVGVPLQGGGTHFPPGQSTMSCSLGPFQARVFRS